MKDNKKKIGFEVWRSVKLGTVKEDEFPEILENRGYKISGEAWEMLEDPGFTVANEETEVNLFKVTLGQLGVKEVKRETTFTRVCKKAKKWGLNMCPAEVGPQLLLQYSDSLEDELIIIAMKPINHRVFYVGYNRFGKYLNCTHPQGIWKRWLPPARNRWVFCLEG